MKSKTLTKITHIIVLLTILSLLNISAIKASELSKPKSDKPDDTISDAELDEMLKDPKYASLVGKDAAALLSASPTKSKDSPKPRNLKHQSKLKDDPLATLEPDVSAEKPERIEVETKEEKEKRRKREEMEKKFKGYDFISKQQARYLIEILRQPVFFNMLPTEAQSLVKATKDNFQFKLVQDSKLEDYLEANLSNNPTSQTFIDPDGKVGRKGVLTVIDPESGSSKFLWVISNTRTLTFFESQSFLTIVKLFRNSSLVMRDVPATPCFIVYDRKGTTEGSNLVCSNSTQEKEVWMQTISSNLD